MRKKKSAAGEKTAGNNEGAEQKPLFQISGQIYDSERAYLRGLLSKAFRTLGKLKNGDFGKSFSMTSQRPLCAADGDNPSLRDG